MENKPISVYDRTAKLANANINIINVRPYKHPTGDRVVIQYEFQWRDPRSNNHRWAKNYWDFPNDIDEPVPYKHIYNIVQQARAKLEG